MTKTLQTTDELKGGWLALSGLSLDDVQTLKYACSIARRNLPKSRANDSHAMRDMENKLAAVLAEHGF